LIGGTIAMIFKAAIGVYREKSIETRSTAAAG
jgi:hypothetical protein